MKKYFCLCCGYKTLTKTPPGTHEICEICYWQDEKDDSVITEITLDQAKRNFRANGFSKFSAKDKVRKPAENDERHPNWESLYYPGGKKKSLFVILPERKTETDHYIINEVGKPAQKEVFYKTAIYIIEEKDRSVFMDSYTSEGKWITDTWHYNFDDAKKQAEFEFGEPIKNWKEIPNDVTDPLKYVINLKKKN